MEGSGSVQFIDSNPTLVSESTTDGVTTRVYQITPTKQGVGLEIDAFPANNIKLWPPGLDEASADGYWHPYHTAHLEPFRGKVLRFMDANKTNNSGQMNWSDRTPADALTYNRENGKLKLYHFLICHTKVLFLMKL